MKIADDVRHRAAEKISQTRENKTPDRTADRVEQQEAPERHPPDAARNAHRDANPVDVFRQDDGESAELIDQSLDARLRHFIKGVILDRVTRKTPDAVAERVADDAADRSGDEHFQKTVRTEKIAVRHHARQQQRDVALDRAQREYRVNAPRFDELRNLFHR